MSEDALHVVFGTGQVGLALAARLSDLGVAVRSVSRHRPAALADGVDWRAGDITYPEAAIDAARGAAVVYQCLNAPYTQWPELFPPLQRNVLAAAERTDALLVTLENIYGYGPTGGRPMTEDLPLAATTSKGRTRAAMTAELLAAAEAGRARIAVGRASDFFGAGVRESSLGARVFANALAAKRADFIGNPDLLHTYSYVPDIAAGLATLGTDEPGRRPDMAPARPRDRHHRSDPGPGRRRGQTSRRDPQRPQARPARIRTGQPDDGRAGRDVLRVRGNLRPGHHQVRIDFRNRRHPTGYSHHGHDHLVPDPNEPNMTASEAPTGAELTAAAAWSERVRRVGGFIQLAFAAFWLLRGARSIGTGSGTALTVGVLVIVIAVLVYAVRVTAGTGQRPTSPEAKRIERSVTAATVIELVASVALPVIVIAAGHADWVLPSIAITIGPLLLWLDHLVHILRYRPIGWALTVGPFILVATMSGTALAATTGLAAGVLLLGTALAGFHDLSSLRPRRPPTAPRLSTQMP
jgi:NAD dependent epimerase/dehydratase family